MIDGRAVVAWDGAGVIDGDSWPLVQLRLETVDDVAERDRLRLARERHDAWWRARPLDHKKLSETMANVSFLKTRKANEKLKSIAADLLKWAAWVETEPENVWLWQPDPVPRYTDRVIVTRTIARVTT